MRHSREYLEDVARKVASTHGYTVDEATFTRNKEFNLAWRVRDDHVVLKISDYIDEAPEPVVADAVDMCFRHIRRSRRRTFGDDFLSYMRSDEFVLLKRPVYVKRSRNMTMSPLGSCRNIEDSVQRLYDAGLLRDSDIDNSVFTWTIRPNYTKMGYCSTMMRVVAISSVLDDPKYSDNVLDEVVYHECLHLRQGYRPFDHNPHDAAFRRDMKLFPGLEAAEAELRTIPRARR